MSGLFKGQLFKSLEGMVIGGSCLIRRVFTLKSPPPDTTVEPAVTDGLPFEEIPQVYQMPTGGLTIQTQVDFLSLHVVLCSQQTMEPNTWHIYIYCASILK